MLQNTVALHHLGSAIGTMNFVRTLMSTILVAVFGAIVLANAPVAGSTDAAEVHALAATSVTTFSHVFLGVVVHHDDRLHRDAGDRGKAALRDHAGAAAITVLPGRLPLCRLTRN